MLCGFVIVITEIVITEVPRIAPRIIRSRETRTFSWSIAVGNFPLPRQGKRVVAKAPGGSGGAAPAMEGRMPSGSAPTQTRKVQSCSSVTPARPFFKLAQPSKLRDTGRQNGQPTKSVPVARMERSGIRGTRAITSSPDYGAARLHPGYMRSMSAGAAGEKVLPEFETRVCRNGTHELGAQDTRERYQDPHSRVHYLRPIKRFVERAAHPQTRLQGWAAKTLRTLERYSSRRRSPASHASAAAVPPSRPVSAARPPSRRTGNCRA